MKFGFFIFLAIFIALNFYIFIRGRQALPSDKSIQLIYTAVFLLFSSSFFIGALFEGKIPSFIIAIAENMGGFWMITLLYFLAAVLIADILRLSDYLFGIFPEKFKAHYSQVKLYYFGTVLLLLFVFSFIGYIRYSNPKTVSLNLDIPNGTHSGSLSIVAVSDLHLGNVIRKGRLSKNVALINSHNPDIILIAGDLFDRNLHTVEEQQMDKILGELKAKLGVYAVLGNHEYFGDVNRAIGLIRNAGITLLRDSALIIDNKFVLIGRDDHSNRKRKPLKEILSGINLDMPRLLLDHQPVQFSEAVENKIDFQFSGHTHNGQIYPMNLVVAKMYELAYGYKQYGETHFYVSSGLGLWGTPIRLGTQSEIVKIQVNFIPDSKMMGSALN